MYRACGQIHIQIRSERFRFEVNDKSPEKINLTQFKVHFADIRVRAYTTHIHIHVISRTIFDDNESIGLTQVRVHYECSDKSTDAQSTPSHLTQSPFIQILAHYVHEMSNYASAFFSSLLFRARRFHIARVAILINQR